MNTNSFIKQVESRNASKKRYYINRIIIGAIISFVMPFNLASSCGGYVPIVTESEDSACDLYRIWTPPVRGMDLEAYQWDGYSAGSVSISTQYLDQYCGVSPATCGTTSARTGISDIPGLHPGIDISVPEGTQVYAITNGVVTFSGELAVWGKVLIIRHDHIPTVQDTCYDTKSIYSVYAHLSEIFVDENTNVNAGRVIGESGDAGTGAHLHFQIQRYDESTPYWPVTSGNLDLCSSASGHDDGRLCRAFDRAEQSDVISSTYHPIKTIKNRSATEGSTHPDLGNGGRSSRAIQVEFSGSLTSGQKISTPVETTFGEVGSRGGDDPIGILYDYLDRIESEGAVLAIPDIGDIGSIASSRSVAEDAQGETTRNTINPHSVVFEGYLEIEVVDDGDVRLADQIDGNWSAYYTPYSLLCTPGCWWRRDMTVYYYDHKDTGQIHLPGHLGKPGRVLTFETGARRERRRTKHNQQVIGAYYQNVYREDYGYGGSVTKRFELADHELRYIFQGKPITISGVVSTTKNKTGTTAPDSLKVIWQTRDERTDFRVVRTTVGMTLTPSALVRDPEVKTETVRSSCKAILDEGESVGDGPYTIDPDGDGGIEPFEVYCDMTIDGGGWTVVAAQNLETPVMSPDGVQYDGNDGYYHNKGHHVHKFHFPPESEDDIPTTIPSDETYTTLRYWPFYSEYLAVSLYSEDLGDGSTTSKQWKYSTNDYGITNINLIEYIVDNFEEDDPLDIVNSWEDCNPHEYYWGLAWFGGECNTFDHWSQADLMGTLLETDIFQIDTSFKGFIDVTDCGMGWANSDCRRSLASYTRKDEIVQKLVVMVREE